MINDSWRFGIGSVEKRSSQPVLYIFFVAETLHRVCPNMLFYELRTVGRVVSALRLRAYEVKAGERERE